MKAHLETDGRGFPVLLAGEGTDFPVLVANPSSPIQDGEGTKEVLEPDPPAPSSRPDGVGHGEWSRRADVVRDAAREFESFTPEDVRDWVKGKTNRVFSETELKAFAVDVRAQQVDDLVDILDHSERGKLRSRRFVRISAPRGYVRKTLNSLSDSELKIVGSRLKSRGWTEKQMAGLKSRLPEKRQGVLDKFSQFDMSRLERPLHPEPGLDYDMMLEAISTAAETMARNMPAPSLTVQPQVTIQAPEPRPMRIKRDDRGFLAGVEPVEVDDAG